MQLLDSDKNLGEVEQRLVHCQAHVLPNLLHQLATRQILEHKVKVVLILQCLHEVDEEANFSRFAAYAIG